MISAIEARDLMPKYNPDEYLIEIEALIRTAAEQNKVSVTVHRVLPQEQSAAWCVGRKTELTSALTKALTDSGFTIQRDAGGHHGPGYVEISWGKL